MVSDHWPFFVLRLGGLVIEWSLWRWCRNFGFAFHSCWAIFDGVGGQYYMGNNDRKAGKPSKRVFFVESPEHSIKVFGTILICPEYSTVCWGYGFYPWLFWFWRWLICILCLNTFQLAAEIHVVKRVLVPHSAISTYVSMYGAVSASMRALQIRQALAFLYKIIPPSEWGSEPEWSLLSALPLHQGPPGCIGANWYCCCWWKKSC